jgi:hypothetical protein
MRRKHAHDVVTIVWQEGRWNVYLNGRYVESHESAAVAADRKAELEMALAA